MGTNNSKILLLLCADTDLPSEWPPTRLLFSMHALHLQCLVASTNMITACVLEASGIDRVMNTTRGRVGGNKLSGRLD